MSATVSMSATVFMSALAMSGCAPGEEDWLPSDSAVALALGQPAEGIAAEASAFVEDGRAPVLARSAGATADPASKATLHGPDALSFTFARGAAGFVHDFSNFAPSQFALLDSEGGLAADPFVTDGSVTTAYRLTATTSHLNRPLSLLLKRPVGLGEGLLPSSQYVLDFYVTLTSSVPLDCAPHGASEPVAVLKAGAVSAPPVRELDSQTGLYQYSFDDGAFARSGTAMSTGFDAVRSCEQLSAQGHDEVYRISHRYPVTTTPEGKLWLLVGVELAPQETTTDLSFSQVDVVIRPTRSSDPRLESGS